MAPRGVLRLGGVRGGEDGVAARFQDLAHQVAHARLVFDQEDRLDAAKRRGRRAAERGGGRGGGGGARQVDLEGRAAPRRARHRDRAVALGGGGGGRRED